MLVAKRWMNIDGQDVLVEAVDWVDLEPKLRNLAEAPVARTQLTPVLAGRSLPQHSVAIGSDEPVQLAQVGYASKGVTLDYTALNGVVNSYTFQSGLTYYISSSFGIGNGTTTIQPNTTVKYAPNAYLYIYGPVDCQATAAQMATFTCRDDDNVGQSLPSETGNQGQPFMAASQAIWLYYLTIATELKNIRVRWAQRGLQYDSNPGYGATHTFRDSKIENCQTGIYAYFTSVSLVNAGYCCVSTPTYASGYSSFSGTLANECVNSLNNINVTKAFKNQSEAEISINPAYPNNIFILSAKSPPHRDGTLAAMMSADSGTTWTNRPLASPAGYPAPLADPAVAFDQFGNLFVAYLCNNADNDILVLLSTDGGNNFTLVKQFTKAMVGGTRLDKPAIATGPGTGGSGSTVWITFSRFFAGPTFWQVMAAGACVNGLGNICANPFQQVTQVSGNDSHYGSISVGPAGQVAVAYQEFVNSSPAGPSGIKVSVDPDGLGSNPFPSATSVATTYVGGRDVIEAHPITTIYAVPGVAWDRSSGSYRGRLYLVYTQESPDESGDDTHIHFTSSNDGGATWGTPVQVNYSGIGKSQFFPRMAVDQGNGDVAVCWYDCSNDPANIQAELWGTVSHNGGQTFLINFQISSGKSDYRYDSDTFDYGDYIGIDVRGGWMFPVWADNSNSTCDNPDGRTRFEIYTRKMAVP